MSDIIFIIFIALVFVVGSYYFYNKFKKSKNNDLIKNSVSNIHIQSLPKKRKIPIITLDESWKFIQDITEKVLAKFSKKDQALLMELGKILSSVGMIYNHIIEYGVRYNKQKEYSHKNKKSRSSKDQIKNVS
jgi:hypothetical protein